MRKYFVLLILTFTMLVISDTNFTYAMDTNASPSIINARILPTIWYSTLSIEDGESIKIYSAIQNNSEMDFTGNAIFYVDDKEISRVPFSSNRDNLIDVSTSWLANPGSHNVQVKISTSLSADMVLVSYMSDKSSVSISKKITGEVIQGVALSTANSIVSVADNIAEVFAEKVEGYKKPLDTNIDTIKISPDQKGHILGTSTVQTTNSALNKNSKTDSVFNMILDLLAFLIRNWKWTLGAVVILFLIFKFTGGRRK